MFSRTKNSTTMKIEVISSLWSVLLIAMLAGTFTLYDSEKSQVTSKTQEITSRSQPLAGSNLR
jgi:hypothetical protein